MIDLRRHAEGTILPVRAQAGSRRNEIRGEQDGMLKVCVTQAPEKGKANKAIIAQLSRSLEIKKSRIELLSGTTSPKKQFLVRGVSERELARQVEEIL